MGLFDTELEEELDLLEDQDTTKKLIVYNDDYNTFMHVIICLVKYCGIDVEKAKEYAIQIHENGLSIVKDGSRQELNPIKRALNENGLTAKIED